MIIRSTTRSKLQFTTAIAC